MFVKLCQHILSTETKIFEPDPGTVSSGRVPSIMKLEELLTIKLKKNKVIKSRVNIYLCTLENGNN